MSINKEKYLKLATPLDEFEKELNISEESRKRINNHRNFYDLLYKLRDIRKKKGLTQQELARKAGLRRASVSDIETGKANITLSTLIDVANALGQKVNIKLTKIT